LVSWDRCLPVLSVLMMRDMGGDYTNRGVSD